jgi:hypothetical protein
MVSVFFGYISYVIINWGVQPSISASYYVLPKGYNLFAFATIGYSFPAIILGVLLAHSVGMFLTGSMLAFVAVAYDYRSGQLNNTVHTTAAQIAVGISQLALIFEFKMWYISAASLAIAGVLFLFPKLKNMVWWQEIIVIVGLFVALGIKLVQYYIK